ncbi:MAG: glutamate synthase large subunit [Myxococcota bacterium]|nr:glutamate synthase large subunit [Myxococcota bacterium]
MTFKQPKKYGLYDASQERDSCGVGFVANIRGVPSRVIVTDALDMLERMDHRGAYGAEKNTGDGSGILVAMPESFIRRIVGEDFDRALPEAGAFGVGMFFLPTEPDFLEEFERKFKLMALEVNVEVVGFREVPLDSGAADLGPTALNSIPTIRQVIVEDLAPGKSCFERRLFALRKRLTNHYAGYGAEDGDPEVYCVSMSSRTLIYKGMLAPYQLPLLFSDLRAVDFESCLAMVHSRFSTNTFPAWHRAQPNRMMSHNGEINTLRGNKNFIRGRQGRMETSLPADLEGTLPVCEPALSDSGTFDNVLEYLVMSGYDLPQAVMMMVPEAWENHTLISPKRRAFYEFYSNKMEPWDGPASVAFTDGRYVGAVLDRNGLRPSRYYLTKDDRVIMASEVGVVSVPPEMIEHKGRLQPGRMFLVDFAEGRLIADEDLKDAYASKEPYGSWLGKERIRLSDLPQAVSYLRVPEEQLAARLKAAGFTDETFKFFLEPMLSEKRDPISSMGNDLALACLSEKPRLLYDYFRQLFAQVTNPPIDPIREEVIMSLQCPIGPEGNLLVAKGEDSRRVVLEHPILGTRDFARLKAIDTHGLKSVTVDITWPRYTGAAGLEEALAEICKESEKAVDSGYAFVILTDRKVGRDRLAISALAACGAVHHHLVKKGKRTQAGLLVETGEAREVHHFCLLVGYGADAIYPYLALDSLCLRLDSGLLKDIDVNNHDALEELYRKAAGKGILKVMAKMGISTLKSYKGAQIFEALGLGEQVIESCFSGTASRIGGLGFGELATEWELQHAFGYPQTVTAQVSGLGNQGLVHWRSGGEEHMWEPNSIASLQEAARTNNREAYKRFSQRANTMTGRCELRGLLSYTDSINPTSVGEVEPAEEIVKKFVTGAMSFGSISAESHESLAVAMNRLGGKSNTGEGGEDPQRFMPLENGDSKRSAIKQVASGRFGVNIWYLYNADEIQIKIAQGAKPGEGGELPGRKVDYNIANIRYSTPGVGLISPPPHHDIYSIEDLKQLIQDLKHANPNARISVKLVSEVGVGTVAAGVTKAHADHILISSAAGGTGASPLTSIKHAGLPWELGLAEVHQTLVMNDLRSRVVVQVDGQLKTGRDVVIGAILGAEEFGFSTAPLVSMGCIMMRKCHLNTCPVGIATQDPELRKKFEGAPEHVVNYLFMVAEEVREILASLGFKRLKEVVGRVDLLKEEKSLATWKGGTLNLSNILLPALKPKDEVEVTCNQSQDHGLEKALDHVFIRKSEEALRKGAPVRFEAKISNTDRVVGALLSHRVVGRWGGNMLPEDTIWIDIQGSAGQSFGAWLASGVTLNLEGDANDYVGKGLSGGKIIVQPPKDSTFLPENNVLVGNVCLYGATGGMVFLKGIAAERFGVRNSGAKAVVEGVGDHGCEYMTGGRIVVLGPTGRNFAAGMSGGIAYVWDPKKKLSQNCNHEMVELEKISTAADRLELRALVALHFRHTGSEIAREILSDWASSLESFVKVMPLDYKRVLEGQGGHFLAPSNPKQTVVVSG